MKKSAYPVVSGLVFLLVAAGHAARALRGTNVYLGLHRIPIWGSWVVAVVAALLALWAFRSRSD
jgi:uncharacterized membrane protein